MPDSLSIAAFLPYAPDTTPSQRFRIEQWMPHLAAEGIQVELRPFANRRLMQQLYRPGGAPAKAAGLIAAFARRLVSVASVRRHDVVLVHRAVALAGPALIEHLLARLGRPLIYDFDDAIFLQNTTDANRRFAWLKFPGKTAAICRLSSHVVVGNAYLAEYARRHNPRVAIIPTSIDTESYRPLPKQGPAGRVVVGWTGSSTSQLHLEAFAPVLRELTRRRDVELRVFSDREPLLPELPVVWRRWSADVAAEVRELAEFDVGIMPVPDDAWARGKCALKALQYMAMGVPAVCSAVGANRELIDDGRNGFLASSPEQWLARLEALIDDAGLRARLGHAGRLTIEQRYSARHCAASFAELVRGSVAAVRGAREVGMGNLA